MVVLYWIVEDLPFRDGGLLALYVPLGACLAVSLVYENKL
jgi:hypothetical protein